MNKVEIRCELRSENEGRHISGKAISFDTQSNDIGFIEILHRGCISQELIDSSNIVFLYNHDYNQVIARANKGKGTLNIDLRDDGVYFDLDVPNTTMGNDLLENIRLGNITQCSFGFRYANEEGAYKDEKIDDVWYRNVYKIGELFDLSAVTYPAYDDTYVNARMQERSKMEDKLKETEEIQVEVRSEEKKEDEEKSDEKDSEKNSDEKEINNKDNTKSEEEKSEEEKTEKKDEKDSNTDDKKSDKEDKDSDSKKDSEDDSKTDSKDKKRNENKKSYKMDKNIILSEIRSALNSADHKVTLPAETRAVTQTVTAADGVHDEIVETEFKGLLEPLYADSVISNLGITIYNGLPAGDFKVSAMGKGAAAWADETGIAADSKNTFTHVTLQPKRISAQLSYSKQFLAQDTIGAEAAIRRDIYNALVAQIQSTMLSADAAGTNKPAGIFNGVTAKNISSYAELCNVEADVDDSNVKGERKYLMSNKAKAILRCMPKSSLATELVLHGNDIDGTQVIANSDVPTTQYAYGDFSNIVMGTWGNVDLIIDPYTLAAENSVRIVVNAFVDWKKVRSTENVLVYGKVSAPASTGSK